MYNKNLLVSIILPTYKEAPFIVQAIQSVQNQSYNNWDLIIIDDGLYESVAERIQELTKKDPRVIYIKNNANIGIQKSLNRGIHESKGEYIARIDDDDEWNDPDKLKKQMNFFEENPECVLVGTGVMLVEEEGHKIIKKIKMPGDDETIRKKILFKNCFIHSSVVFKKRVVEECGKYDESERMLHVEDYDLWLKMGAQGKMGNIPDFSTTTRMRADSISAKNKLDQFKKDIQLTKLHGRNYDHVFLAIIFTYIRLYVFKIFGFMLNPQGKIYSILKSI